MSTFKFSKIQEILYIYFFLSLVVMMIGLSDQKKGTGGNPDVLLNQLKDLKEFKKLLKSKNNVLIYFENQLHGSSKELIKLFNESWDEIRGIGTIAIVRCYTSGETSKLCKKLKIFSDTDSSLHFLLKHYKDGDYHKDYDRALKVESIVNFMKDPTGDLPWDEDPTGKEVLHLKNPQALQKLISKTSKTTPALIMFYAPWCGYCKKMKPDYGAAAKELKDLKTHGILAAIDANLPENSSLRSKFNISGFPTLLYFTGPGSKSFRSYEGENTKDGILAFMKDPEAAAIAKEKVEKVKEISWAEEEGENGAVAHLSTENFDEFIQTHDSVVVMFYAPWCGHCKKLKPAYSSAAQKLQSLQISGKLAAVDATVDPDLAKRFSVSGYPTLKYFQDKNLEPAFELGSETRTEESLIEFLRDPKPPPPPPPPEIPWAQEEDQAVVHLTSKNFKSTLTKKSIALLMFYAPWCGYCKQTKPEFIGAAEELAGENGIIFGAIDCTQESELCGRYEVKGYPTFKVFKYFGDKAKEEILPYEGGRTKQDMINEARNLKSTTGPKANYDDWNGLPGHEAVNKLTDESLAQFIKTHEQVLVMFYAPWCGHCRAMKPEFALAAQKLARDSPKSMMAAIDCVQFPRVLERYRIQGYPTLKYYHWGNYVGEYKRGRKASEFISFMIRKPSTRDEL